MENYSKYQIRVKKRVQNIFENYFERSRSWRDAHDLCAKMCLYLASGEGKDLSLCYRNWVHSPGPAKKNTDVRIAVKESEDFIAGCQARRVGSSYLRPDLPDGLQVRVFKRKETDVIGKVINQYRKAIYYFDLKRKGGQMDSKNF